ncbi:hypothetical protein DFJ74DRAFT_711330 [Hyaloraphidium curvatum]|nr:hypothetical protein DFJ74DRAFT_711330 [Hyaloraphidium curvatum]
MSADPPMGPVAGQNGAGAPAGNPLPPPPAPLAQTKTVASLESMAQTIVEPVEDPDREVVFPSTRFVKNANYIKTTKYTILTFLPLNLWSQFHRLYNLYFLLGALSTIGGQSAVSAWTAIFPLMFILAVTAAKDGWEDYKRYKADQKANNEPVTIVKDGKEQVIPSKNVQVGEILKVHKGEKFAADLVVLDTSFDDGVSYIETADLDGETNLKRRTALPETKGFALSPFPGKVQAGVPNKDLHEFDARLVINRGTRESVHSLSINQFLPRGAVLRNTEFVYAVAVYTGLDTKVMKNNTRGALKFSTLEGRLNALVFGIFLFNLVLLISAVLLSLNVTLTIYNGNVYYWYLANPNDPNDEFQPNRSGVNYAAVIWNDILTWFATLSYVIPLSLFVSIELVRIVQTWMIQGDERMVGYRKPDYNPRTTALGKDGFLQLTLRKKDQTMKKAEVAARFGTDLVGETGDVRVGFEKETDWSGVPDTWTRIGATVNNSNLNEDLGVLDFLFSDKTGTLTRNEMTLNKAWIPYQTFDDVKDVGRLGKAIARGHPGEQLHDAARLFAEALAVCHDVLPTMTDDPSQGLLYESPSPDDIAICNGLRRNGVEITGRTKTLLQTSWFNEERDYEFLRLLEFSSDRKRMSAIVRKDGVIYLYIKGADNVILSLAKPDHDQQVLEAAGQALNEFARDGLRTLVVGYRTLSEEDWIAFRDQLDAAEKRIKDRDARMARVMDTVERDITILGVTGIQDRLQDQVPETIAYLLQCDIKVWVLTGDKQETAINIGLASRVINNDSRLFVYNMRDRAALEAKLDETISQLKAAGEWGKDHVKPEDMMDPEITKTLSLGQRAAYAWKRFRRYMAWLMPVNRNPRAGWGDPPEVEDTWRRNAMVVTGDALNILFEPWGTQQHGRMTDLQRKFLEVGTRCKSVICCRVAPLQKAQIVRLVSDGLHKVSLAVGDGANDVPMIQAANIGVGISGREGGQAVRASDYSFLEFKNLRTLISVHGRWSFLRMCQLIYYSFYKNIAMISVYWIYGFFTLWSGTNIYEETFLVYFNVAFSAVPPFVVACFEKDVARTPLYRYPELYREARVHYWNLQTFAGWILAAVIVSNIVFFVGFGFWGEGILSPNGWGIGYDSVIYVWSSLILTTVMYRLAIMVKGWTHLHWAAIALSFLLWIALQLFSVSRDFLAITFGELHSIPTFWFMIMFVPVAGIILDWGLIARRVLFDTPDYRIINEEWAVECERNKYLDPNTGTELPRAKTLPEGLPGQTTMNISTVYLDAEPALNGSSDLGASPSPSPSPSPSASPGPPSAPVAREITWPAVQSGGSDRLQSV